jgi:hypothetical protein
MGRVVHSVGSLTLAWPESGIWFDFMSCLNVKAHTGEASRRLSLYGASQRRNSQPCVARSSWSYDDSGIVVTFLRGGSYTDPVAG